MDLRAFIFIPALVACIIVGFVFAVYAAHYYLNVMQSTGAGARQVVYASEPLVDNMWKALYLGVMIGLWLGPAWLLGRAFSHGPQHAWLRYAIPLAVFWICYPLSQISSLSGPTIWLPFHHEVFARLARKPGLFVSFLVISGGVLTLLGLGFHLTFHAEGLTNLFIGAPLFIIAALLYARLLGRLAFALMYTRSILSRKKKKKAVDEPPPPGPRAISTGGWEDSPPEERAEPAFEQPSELPPIQTPDEGELHGYNIQFEDAKPKPRKPLRATSVNDSRGSEATPPSADSNPASPEPSAPRKRPDEDDDFVSYGVKEAEVVQEERAPAEIVKPSELEMKLLSRDDAPKPPKQVWNGEVFAFLLQADTIPIIGLLTVLCLVLGGLVRVAIAFNPASEG